MRYEQFLDLWTQLLHESGMRVFGFAKEAIDLTDQCRSYEVLVEPVGRQDAEPFTVTAHLSWRWPVMQAARTATSEEDSYMRVDVRLNATLPHNGDRPMPDAASWRRWVTEVQERVDSRLYSTA